jgi:hypothetical protein
MQFDQNAAFNHHDFSTVVILVRGPSPRHLLHRSMAASPPTPASAWLSFAAAVNEANMDASVCAFKSSPPCPALQFFPSYILIQTGLRSLRQTDLHLQDLTPMHLYITT